jgi:hypothetical protein
VPEDIQQWFDRRRDSSCGEKRQFESEREALDAAYLIRLQGGDRLDVYHCLFCHRWHLGHSDRE